MNVLAPFRTNLYRLIRSTLPEITGPVATVPQIQRLNWVNQVKAGGLVPPWVAVHIPALTTETIFASLSAPTWRVTPTIYFISAVADGDGNIGDYLESRLSLLQDALIYQFPYTIPPSANPVIDASEDNPVNASFLTNDMPFLSASLTFSAIVGYVRPS